MKQHKVTSYNSVLHTCIIIMGLVSADVTQEWITKLSSGGEFVGMVNEICTSGHPSSSAYNTQTFNLSSTVEK